MTIRMTEREDTNIDIEQGELAYLRQKMLEKVRLLDQMGRRFEKFMSLELQRLELAVESFQREKDAWRRQRDREAPAYVPIQQTATDTTKVHDSSADVERFMGVAPTPKIQLSENCTSPLRILIHPGSASAMQIGLLLFELSKFDRELGGGGVRFDVNSVRLLVAGSKNRVQRYPILGFEAFSFVPLIAQNGEVTRLAQTWENFKSQMLMSSLLDHKLSKAFRRGEVAPRDHEARTLAVEATRRADTANCRSDIVKTRAVRGLFQPKKLQNSTHQQLQRVEDVNRYLQNECSLRMHISLVW